MNPGRTERVDVLIIGAGQAGLAVGRELARRGVDVLLVDRGPGAGHTWRDRWDSLRLFTPARYNCLPGLAFPGPPDTYPTKDRIADYLTLYHDHVAPPVRWHTPVTRLGLAGPAPARDGYLATTPAGPITARRVIIATGPFQRPRRPALATRLAPSVTHLHSAEYRNPTTLPYGPTLVVGGGNSGVQIADELATTRPVTLAVGQRQPRVPTTFAGRQLFWWLDRSGVLRIRADTRFGRWMSARASGVEVLVGDSPRRLASRRDVRLTNTITEVAPDRRTLRAADGTVHQPAVIIWATGYGPDYPWLDLPVLGPDGRVRQRLGRTDLPGLYTLGLPWQYTISSSFLAGVSADAARLAATVHAGLGRLGVNR